MTDEVQRSALLSRNMTMQEILSELRARLGQVVQGPGTSESDPVLKSFVRDAHDSLAMELGPTSAVKRTIIKLEPGSFLYDWHNDIEDEIIDPGRVNSIWIHRTDTDRYRLRVGITEPMRASVDRGEPRRYDMLNGQIEVWPVPDTFYDMMVEYIASPGRFEQKNDLSAVPGRLVFQRALGLAQVYYQELAGSQATLALAQKNLTNTKFAQLGEKRFFAGGRRGTGNNTVSVSAGGAHTMVVSDGN